jgi:hypothetical protein
LVEEDLQKVDEAGKKERKNNRGFMARLLRSG